MKDEKAKIPFLVVGRDSFGQPVEVLLTSSSQSKAEGTARELSRKGLLRNQFGREMKGPFRAKQVTWEYVDHYLETAQTKYPSLFVLGDASYARELLRHDDETWYTGWQSQIKPAESPESSVIPVEERLVFTLPPLVARPPYTNGGGSTGKEEVKT